jgi:hypothetical protein
MLVNRSFVVIINVRTIYILFNYQIHILLPSLFSSKEIVSITVDPWENRKLGPKSLSFLTEARGTYWFLYSKHAVEIQFSTD